MLMPTKILVPTDFSEYSDKALEQALDIAKEYHAEVFLLHVMHEELKTGYIDFAISQQELWHQIREATQERLQNQLNKFPQAKEVEVVTSIREGVPYEKILDEAKEKGIDLIVIDAQGRTGIAKYFIGGVARNVLKGSKCPVLLTR
jgi:universal stress protein A